MPEILTAIVDTQTGLFVDSGHVEDARYVRVTLPRNPESRVEKWNGNLTTPGFVAKTAPELAADAAAVLTTTRTAAQITVDAWPIEVRALVLALIDQLNVIRAALPVPLGAITPAQALAAIRVKAGTLT